MTDIQLIHGEMLETMRGLEAQSVDAIITDLPYGTTACKWDQVIPFAPMWEAVKNCLKPRCVFVTTASQPFTSLLVCSNLEWFKYDIVWDKITPTGFLNCNNAPLRSHETILFFYRSQPVFNPQKILKPYKGSRTGEGFTQEGEKIKDGVYGTLKHGSGYRSEYSFPKSVWEFPTGNGHTKSHNDHPTQKPVALYEYLIKTYTNPGDLVGDFCFGSGTTAVACVNTGRRFIGCEKERNYYEIAVERVAKAQAQIRMPLLEGVRT